MNDRERFCAVMNYDPVDRLPVYYFGLWRETRTLWLQEGLDNPDRVAEATGMDPDWEQGLWKAHGIFNYMGPIADGPHEVLEETESYIVRRSPLGSVIKSSKIGESISQHLEYDLKPDRESWARFRAHLDPADPRRRADDWEEKLAALAKRERVTGFLAGSLYGWPRDWMGVEELSYLAYDNPNLYEEIVEFCSDYFMALYRPLLGAVQFDLAYFFEDCCFNTGPLFSPEIYRKFYHRHYKRMIDFYHDAGVKYVMVDSDGKVDDLIPCWLDSGFDVVFPIEVGTWKADPRELRKRFGKRLRMFGGVDKHVIPHGAAAIRKALDPLRPLVEEGGYIPIPDHRIPPDCTLDQFRVYVEVFKQVFWP